MAVTNAELIEAVHRFSELRDAMSGLYAIDEARVQLSEAEFERRFPDRSEWSFKPYGPGFSHLVGEWSVYVSGVKFFTLEHKKEENANETV